LRKERAVQFAVTAIAAVLALAGCGLKSGMQTYSDKLKNAGFDKVTASRDEEKSGKKNKLVAYDFDWTVNTDDDPATCTVELEYPAESGGSLTGDDWHIDEVNGDDITGWGAGSPDAQEVRRLLKEHGYDC
jgi:predicted small lipoprotein YifL